MNDFHSFDNAVMARATRLIRTAAILPLAALFITTPAIACGKVAKSDVEAIALFHVAYECRSESGMSLDRVIAYKKIEDANLSKVNDLVGVSAAMFDVGADTAKQVFGNSEYAKLPAVATCDKLLGVKS